MAATPPTVPSPSPSSSASPAPSGPLSIKDFFNRLSADQMQLVEEFYTPDVRFKDPVHELRGVQAVRDYYANMYKNVISIRFEIHDEIVQGDDHVATWTMYLRAQKLKGGEPIAVEGASHVRFDPKQGGRASYHRDYFDMGEFVYENVPVLSQVIRFIKGKLAGP